MLVYVSVFLVYHNKKCSDMFFISFYHLQMNTNYILNETDVNKIESIINELVLKNDIPLIRLLLKHNPYVNQLHPRYINHKYHIPGYRFTSIRKQMALRRDNYKPKNNA